MTKGSEPLLWLRELTDLGGTCEFCDLSAVPAIERLAVDQGYFGWTFRMPGHVTRDTVAEIFDFVGDEVAIAFGADAAMPPPRIAVWPAVSPRPSSGRPAIASRRCWPKARTCAWPCAGRSGTRQHAA